MSGKIMDEGVVLSQECLSEGVYSMIIKTKIGAMCSAGQFVSVYTKDASRLLPRPISICSFNAEEETLRLVYRVAGEGTKQFSEYKEGDTVRLLGPLGNGFTLEGKHPLLVGGGIGVPPMLGLAEAYKAAVPEAQVSLVMGYRNADTFLEEELRENGTLYIATDDGSLGTHGTVIDAIKENSVECDAILACGPKPMLRALKEYAAENNIPCWISMEERMACGIGACLGCVCKTTEIDDHSKVHNKRVCADGPVFNAKEVDLT